MNDNDRRRVEMGQRVSTFCADNDDALKTFPIYVTNKNIINTELAFADTQGALQQTGLGSARGAFEAKDTARENLRERMSPIVKTARRMEPLFDGISDIFRMPRNRNDQDLLAAARAFIAQIPAFKDGFLSFAMPPDFDVQLQNAIDAFEASLVPPGSATDQHVEATAEMGASVRRMMLAVRIVDGIVRNVFAGDIGKLAAWESASHVEKAPQTPKPKSPPPTP